MPFVSFAQNLEDVVLWRALHHVHNGFYVDVGANDPTALSVTRAFYDRGWHGINIDPATHEELAAGRPRDVNLPFAVGAEEGETTFWQVADSALSTCRPALAEQYRLDGREVVEKAVQSITLTRILEKYAAPTIHFMNIDVEGSELEVLRGLDLDRWRPWILVVEATLPGTRIPSFEDWEPLVTGHGYEFAYFDALNRFYVAREQRRLKQAFQFPPNIFDDYVTSRQYEDGQELLARQELLQRQDAELARQAALIRAQAGDIEAKERVVQEQAIALTAASQAREGQASQLASREQTIERLELDLASRDDLIRAQEETIRAKDSRLASALETLRTQEARLAAAHEAIGTQEAKLAAANEAIRAQEAKLVSANQAIGVHEAQLQAKEEVIRAFRGSFMYWFANGRVRKLYQFLLAVKHPSRFGTLLMPRLGTYTQYAPRPLRTRDLLRQEASGVRPETTASISVVTASYNQASFVERTVRSVLDQGYPCLQYIVQDGASTDDTVAVLARYEQRLGHLESRPDRGQAHALNLGFQISSGEIMAYLNADDFLLPGALDYVNRYFARHSDVDVIYSHRVIVDEHDQQVGMWILPPHDNQILLWADYVPQETMFWRRSLWERVGGYIDESYQFAMDWELLLRFRAAGARMRRVPVFLAAFRTHDQQKSVQQLAELGAQEMQRLRSSIHGRELDWREINKAIRPYLTRSLIYHYLYALGILR